jgi:hypothetical protein
LIQTALGSNNYQLPPKTGIEGSSPFEGNLTF